VYFFVVDHFTAISLRDAPLHAIDKAGLVREHAIDGPLHELLRVGSIRSGHLFKPRFDIGREMDFHILQVKRKSRETRQRGSELGRAVAPERAL
jgi:hypothetical protein